MNIEYGKTYSKTPQIARKMWEYNNLDELDEVNEWAKEGWELICFVPNQDGGYFVVGRKKWVYPTITVRKTE